jgi:hypothetical protein
MYAKLATPGPVEQQLEKAASESRSVTERFGDDLDSADPPYPSRAVSSAMRSPTLFIMFASS